MVYIKMLWFLNCSILNISFIFCLKKKTFFKYFLFQYFFVLFVLYYLILLSAIFY